MLIKSLANVTVEVALKANEFEGSAALRDQAKKIAKKRLGDGPALLRVKDILARCKDVAEQRNVLIHTTIASDWPDTEAKLYRAGQPPASLPSAGELGELEGQITELIEEINHSRLHGWLFEALAKAAPIL